MKNLRSVRKSRGLSQATVAGILGISPQAYSNYETGNREPSSDTLTKLATYFEVSVDFLLGHETTRNRHDHKIPILGSVPAGVPIEAIEDIEGYVDLSYSTSNKEIFALQVKGNSMEPEIRNKDFVLVSSQETIESGEIAVVRVNGEEATVKRVKLLSNGIMLIPINPDYDPVFFDKDQVAQLPVTIIGKVIEVRRRL